jgi:hypothetical protein
MKGKTNIYLKKMSTTILFKKFEFNLFSPPSSPSPTAGEPARATSSTHGPVVQGSRGVMLELGMMQIFLFSVSFFSKGMMQICFFRLTTPFIE